MQGNKFLFFIYAAGIMFMLLYSMHAYFFWEMYVNHQMIVFLLDFMLAIVGIAYMKSARIRLKFSRNVILSFLIVWLATAWNQGLFGLFFTISPTLLTLLLLNKDSHRILLKVWTTLYAIILLVSVITWPLALLGQLPDLGEIAFGDSDTYIFHNYIFVLINQQIFDVDFLRFHSIFLESGHVAMIGAFTVFANRFNFKKWHTLVIFIVTLITLSLAGFLLLLVGALLLGIQNVKSGKKSLILLGIGFFVIGVYYFGVNFNGGDNIINDLIIERLEYDEDKGIAGNNRVSEDTDFIFERFVGSMDFFVGLSSTDYNKLIRDGDVVGAGYKLYLLEKGLIGILLIFWGYWLISMSSLDRRFVRSFLLLMIVSFLQRAWPTQPIWLYLYIFTTGVEPVAHRVKNHYKVGSNNLLKPVIQY